MLWNGDICVTIWLFSNSEKGVSGVLLLCLVEALTKISGLGSTDRRGNCLSGKSFGLATRLIQNIFGGRELPFGGTSEKACAVFLQRVLDASTDMGHHDCLRALPVAG